MGDVALSERIAALEKQIWREALKNEKTDIKLEKRMEKI